MKVGGAEKLMMGSTDNGADIKVSKDTLQFSI